MSPNIKLSDLMGHSSTVDNSAPSIDNMSRILDAIQSPSKLNRDTFKDSNFSDWRQSFIRVRDFYQSNIGQGLDALKDTHKPEVIAAMRKDQGSVARQSYFDVVSQVSERISTERQNLLTDIKSKKFPLYSARAKTIDSMGIVTVHRSPDMQARAAGASELLIASQTPLKYISDILLENYAAAGRIDLVSALVERAMLNQGELQGKQYQEVYGFGLEHYNRLDIQSDRQIYRQIRGIEKHLLPHVSSSMEWDAMPLVMAESAFQSEMNNDSLLEV